MLELNRLYCMDCMEGMKQFPDGYFDLAITDPPYGLGMEQGANIYAGKIFDKKDWDKSPPPPEYFKELFRVSKNQIIFGGNYFDLPPSRCFIVWDKGEGFYGRTFAECELAWTSFDANTVKVKRDPLARRDYMGKIHPTQKPVALYAWIINFLFEKGLLHKGAKVIDTHVGSGSSLIALDRAGLQYIGFEIDRDYCDAAGERITTELSQLSFIEQMGGGTSLCEQLSL